MCVFFFEQKSNEKARIFDINEDEERVIILCNERVDCHIVLKKIIVVRVLFFCLDILSAVDLSFR